MFVTPCPIGQARYGKGKTSSDSQIATAKVAAQNDDDRQKVIGAKREAILRQRKISEGKRNTAKLWRNIEAKATHRQSGHEANTPGSTNEKATQ